MKQRGFTLIETVISFVFIAMIIAIASFGLNTDVDKAKMILAKVDDIRNGTLRFQADFSNPETHFGGLVDPSLLSSENSIDNWRGPYMDSRGVHTSGTHIGKVNMNSFVDGFYLTKRLVTTNISADVSKTELYVDLEGLPSTSSLYPYIMDICGDKCDDSTGMISYKIYEGPNVKIYNTTSTFVVVNPNTPLPNTLLD